MIVIPCNYAASNSSRRSKSESDIKILSPEPQIDVPLSPPPPDKPPNDQEVLEVSSLWKRSTRRAAGGEGGRVVSYQ